jgi:hypothetical protein
MNNAFQTAMVYGFELPYRNVELRGSGRFYIGAKGYARYPIYYGVCLKSTNLEDIFYEIDNLTEAQLAKKALFEEFAERYNQIPTWQLACVGEFDINMGFDTKKRVLDRIRLWQAEVENGIKPALYQDDTNMVYSEDTIHALEKILVKENMRFMTEEVLNTKNLDEVCELIEEYYAREL